VERHFQRELEGLKTSLIKMGSLVEEGLRLAIDAVFEKNPDHAQAAIELDERIDALELEVDNDIIDLLALQQPVARDLRFIVSAQKLNNDLERIGDHSVNIAQSALTLRDAPETALMQHIPRMAEIVLRMLKDSLDSFIHLDAALARGVLQCDDEIDDLNRKTVRCVVETLKTSPISIDAGLEVVRLSRNLERVADLTTNICEEVVFLAQARVVKHHAEDRGDHHHAPDQPRN
jgi:phosphate transport system protein